MNKKQCVEALNKAFRKREVEKAHTYNLYVIHFPHSKRIDATYYGVYYGPFIAPSDDVAIVSLIEASKSHPEIQNKNVYCIGTFNVLSGVVRGFKARLVTAKLFDFEFEKNKKKGKK